jgi:hypothetical protein
MQSADILLYLSIGTSVLLVLIPIAKRITSRTKNTIDDDVVKSLEELLLAAKSSGLTNSQAKSVIKAAKPPAKPFNPLELLSKLFRR